MTHVFSRYYREKHILLNIFIHVIIIVYYYLKYIYSSIYNVTENMGWQIDKFTEFTKEWLMGFSSVHLWFCMAIVMTDLSTIGDAAVLIYSRRNDTDKL